MKYPGFKSEILGQNDSDGMQVNTGFEITRGFYVKAIYFRSIVGTEKRLTFLPKRYEMFNPT